MYVRYLRSGLGRKQARVIWHLAWEAMPRRSIGYIRLTTLGTSVAVSLGAVRSIAGDHEYPGPW